MNKVMNIEQFFSKPMNKIPNIFEICTKPLNLLSIIEPPLFIANPRKSLEGVKRKFDQVRSADFQRTKQEHARDTRNQSEIFEASLKYSELIRDMRSWTTKLNQVINPRNLQGIRHLLQYQNTQQKKISFVNSSHLSTFCRFDSLPI